MNYRIPRLNMINYRHVWDMCVFICNHYYRHFIAQSIFLSRIVTVFIIIRICQKSMFISNMTFNRLKIVLMMWINKSAWIIFHRSLCNNIDFVFFLCIDMKNQSTTKECICVEICTVDLIGSVSHEGTMKINVINPLSKNHKGFLKQGRRNPYVTLNVFPFLLNNMNTKCTHNTGQEVGIVKHRSNRLAKHLFSKCIVFYLRHLSKWLQDYIYISLFFFEKCIYTLDWFEHWSLVKNSSPFFNWNSHSIPLKVMYYFFGFFLCNTLSGYRR